ncbi:MAG: tetratricopeptide repeat protein [Bacteroidota bacterium]
MEQNYRIKQLEALFREFPDDPFSAYSLALEYTHTDPARAVSLFRDLLKEHPDYLPTYYHAGNLLAEEGFEDEAREVLSKGAELARLQGNAKTEKEISNALVNLEV